ncbi:hypothetical protein [Aromatoleum petrolei]|uniref:Bacterial Pleckstrin homology domain-containing protein n=1 Tax=Aromatoleum petrolei TaxID=76116 RepID=A0ABX1MJX8_9RHOO|nr:hypothetical protein [Aromatoleum petrolei]NMF88264.1 hypothetical protein [Aromatoleum petrolei]
MMLQHFKGSPLWLIGLFILFAEATAGLAAVKIDGWPQAALVIFVISYSTVVTAIFFAFLWFKPENFYGPTEYGQISPEIYAKALKGIPAETALAVTKLEENPFDEDALFSLMDNLIIEDAKQHIVLMRRTNDTLDISDINDQGFTHRYEIVTRGKGVSFGLFSPGSFVRKLQGTELLYLSGGKDKLFLTPRGKKFADWLIRHEKDAETFNSEKGRWGKEQSASDVMKERFGADA